MDGAPHTPPARHKARLLWMQVSIRTMLGLVTLLCVWLGFMVNRAERQSRIVARIEGAGGEVGFSDSHSSEVENWPRRALRRWLSRHYFDDILYVKLAGLHDANQGLQCLTELTSLKVLNLNDSQFNDDALANLSGLVVLERLNLDDTQITDGGLVHLSKLTNLKFLSLVNTRITGAEFSHLAALSQLEWIRLGGSDVTDSGLISLSGLESLRIVELQGTPATEAGAERLRKTLAQGGLVTRQPFFYESAAPSTISPASSAP